MARALRERPLTVGPGRSASGVHLRAILLLAAIAGGVVVSALAELLSALDRLTFGALVLSWGALLLAGAVLAVGRVTVPERSGPRALARSLPALELAMTIWITLVVALTGLLAIQTVPTTWDSMTYHLARVANWAENQSVAFYPTHVPRQLYQPPWAEYAMLHLYVLAGGDRLVNLVQWGSMAGSLVGVSLIAGQLGAGRRGQILAAFVCATIPMGILQSMTTQNDYAVALWLVCMVHGLLALGRGPGPLPSVRVGAALGLALLTKGTAYLFAAPFLAVFVWMGRNRSLIRKVGQTLVIVLCALAVNDAQYLRNVILFGSPLGPVRQGEYSYPNKELSLRILASNVVRNIGVHLGTPFPGVNAALQRSIEATHRIIGIAPDDPRSTWPGARLEITAPVAHEDLAGNGLHLVLLMLATAAAWRARVQGPVRAYAACLVAGFLLFSLLLKWQPWHSRLQLPWFVLGAPAIGVALERLRPRLLALALVILAATSLYFLTANPAHALVGPGNVLSTPRAVQRAAHAGPGYVGATRLVTSLGCQEVGLIDPAGNEREYMMWALLADARWRGRLEPVLVTNISAGLPRRMPALRPCAIILLGWPYVRALKLGTQVHRNTWSHESVQVFVPHAP
jgi:Dolichyl-phosphate-mannose-protein mannosyltransferase